MSVNLARDFRNESVGSVKLYRVEGDTRTELATRDQSMDAVTASRVLVPTEAVAPGTKLLLEASAPGCRPDAPLRAEFEVTDEADVPDTLGRLDVALHQASLEVATVKGSCSETIDAAYADLEVTLADAAKPFADVVHYSLVLDGKPFSSFSADLALPTDLGRGKDRVYAPCEPGLPYVVGGTSLGMHRVQVRGALPDGKIVDTSERSFVLSCPSDRPRKADAGLDAGGDEPSMRDASSRADSAGDKHVSDGCSVTWSSRSHAGWVSAVLLVLASLRRARRQRRGR